MADTSERIILISGLILAIVIVSTPFLQETHEIETYPTKSNIIFRYGVSGDESPNELDTFRGLFKKDMVNKGSVRTKLDFTQEEMDAIYQMMVEIDFFSYPQNYRPTLKGEVIGDIDPYTVYYLEYHGESGPKIVRWNDQYMSTGDPKYNDLNQLARLIIFTIESKPEYQKLPEPTAGYL